MHSVVIVTRNSAADIRACILSVARALPDYAGEIVVVDNASEDATLDAALLAAEEIPRDLRNVKIRSLEANLGYAAAANLGAAEASGEVLFFLNPDTVLPPEGLSRLAAHLLPGVAGVGPVSNYSSGPQKYAGWMPPNDPRARTREFLATDSLLREANAGRAFDAKVLIGFALAIHRAAWEALGPFDEGYILGLEDLEWSLRARRAGWRLSVATDVLVYHKGQASFASLPGSKRYELERRSRNHLRAKLREWYGPVPPLAKELWNLGWFDTRRDDE